MLIGGNIKTKSVTVYIATLFVFIFYDYCNDGDAESVSLPLPKSTFKLKRTVFDNGSLVIPLPDGAR